MPKDHSPLAPGLPNGSIDLNALHDAARAGKIGDAVPKTAILIPEQGVELVPDEVEEAASSPPALPAEPLTAIATA